VTEAVTLFGAGFWDRTVFGPRFALPTAPGPRFSFWTTPMPRFSFATAAGAMSAPSTPPFLMWLFAGILDTA
jgi:hypothetical protein